MPSTADLHGHSALLFRPICNFRWLAGMLELGTWGHRDMGTRGQSALSPFLVSLAKTHGQRQQPASPWDAGPCSSPLDCRPCCASRSGFCRIALFGESAALWFRWSFPSLAVTYSGNNKKELPLKISKYGITRKLLRRGGLCSDTVASGLSLGPRSVSHTSCHCQDQVEVPGLR